MNPRLHLRRPTEAWILFGVPADRLDFTADTRHHGVKIQQGLFRSTILDMTNRRVVPEKRQTLKLSIKGLVINFDNWF